MVDKFKELLAKIKSEKTKNLITLFAITKMDDITDRWTVLLCAPWASGKDSFEYVKKLIISQFSPEELSSVARIGIFDKNTSIVQGLLQYKSGSTIDDGAKINGNVIHSAYILESNPEV